MRSRRHLRRRRRHLPESLRQARHHPLDGARHGQIEQEPQHHGQDAAADHPGQRNDLRAVFLDFHRLAGLVRGLRLQIDQITEGLLGCIKRLSGHPYGNRNGRIAESIQFFHYFGIGLLPCREHRLIFVPKLPFLRGHGELLVDFPRIIELLPGSLNHAELAVPFLFIVIEILDQQSTLAVNDRQLRALDDAQCLDARKAVFTDGSQTRPDVCHALPSDKSDHHYNQDNDEKTSR